MSRIIYVLGFDSPFHNAPYTVGLYDDPVTGLRFIHVKNSNQIRPQCTCKNHNHAKLKGLQFVYTKTGKDFSFNREDGGILFCSANAPGVAIEFKDSPDFNFIK